MKVLFLTNLPSPYRVDFFNELGKYCDLTVVYERHGSPIREKSWVSNNSNNFKVVHLNAKEIGARDTISFKVIKILREKYDHIVISIYSTITSMIAMTYLNLHDIPFIISSDGGFRKKDSNLKYKLKHHFISSASAWFSTGTITTDYLTYYGADINRVKEYPFTSVSEKDILKDVLSDTEKTNYKIKLGMKEKFVLLSVGQFVHRKGYDILLKACHTINSSVGVYIVGGKPTEEYLNLRKQLGLKNVHFIDFMNKDELANYYKAADTFILPTREDIWGLVINEAMSYGLPVISTDKCIAAVELIENDVNGYVVPVEDVDAITDKVNYLVQNEAVRSAQAQAALSKIKKYTIENMAKRHLELFENLK